MIENVPKLISMAMTSFKQEVDEMTQMTQYVKEDCAKIKIN